MYDNNTIGYVTVQRKAVIKCSVVRIKKIGNYLGIPNNFISGTAAQL
jgi:hypothetical protein